MKPREDHVSSPAQVPLASPAHRDDVQHKVNFVHPNRGTNKQDKPKSNMDQRVNTGAAEGSAAPRGANPRGNTKARSRADVWIPAH
ncbi:hypothetical protein COP2_013753 [Malus domestica]